MIPALFTIVAQICLHYT